jgi:CubicO group peptidase (beta-lactamase class C family)
MSSPWILSGAAALALIGGQAAPPSAPKPAAGEAPVEAAQDAPAEPPTADVPSTAGDGSAMNGEPGAALDAIVRERAPKGWSGVVLVAKGGEVVLCKGYGSSDGGAAPMRADSVMAIGSNTKPFTAAAILRLQSAGKLKVSDTLGTFFPDAPADKRPITLHQMLTHTSGLGEYHDVPGEGGDFATMTRDEAVRRILAEPLRFAPGAESGYSNCAYTLLAVLVEQLSGRTWEDFLRDELLLPAGMKDTGFFGEERWPDARVPAGRGERTVLDNRPTHWPLTWSLKGAGGIVSTGADMLRWQQALRGDTLLDAPTRAAAFSVQHESAEMPGAGEGYGWMVLTSRRGTRVLNHAGADDMGFCASLFLFVDEDAVLSVMSCTDAEPEARAPMVQALLTAMFPPEQR